MNDITSGQIWRGWAYLFLVFFLGVFYFSFLATGYATAGSLVFILIGLPILLLMFAITRGLAVFDHRLAAMVMGTDSTVTGDDLDTRGTGFLEKLSLYAASPFTWLSLVYLLLQFPLGLFAMTAITLLLPFQFLEVLLAMVGLRTGMVSGKLAYLLAAAMHTLSRNLLPSNRETVRREQRVMVGEKRKNEERLWDADDFSDDAPDDGRYFLGDDGELIPYAKPKRG